MQYKHCIFDLYGTLVDIHTEEDIPRVWEETAAFYGRQGAAYAPEELQHAYGRLVRLAERNAAERDAPLRQDAHEGHPEIQIEYVFQRLFLEKGVAADMALSEAAGWVFRRASTMYIRLYDGAESLLKALRTTGRGVWLLSNAQSCFTQMELRNLGLLPLFDGIALSSDYQCKKPDIRFFQSFLETYHIIPQEAIMVGNDGLCDVQGARNAGLAAIYIRSNLSPEEPLPPADYVLPNGMDAGVLRAILTNDRNEPRKLHKPRNSYGH